MTLWGRPRASSLLFPAERSLTVAALIGAARVSKRSAPRLAATHPPERSLTVAALIGAARVSKRSLGLAGRG